MDGWMGEWITTTIDKGRELPRKSGWHFRSGWLCIDRYDEREEDG